MRGTTKATLGIAAGLLLLSGCAEFADITAPVSSPEPAPALPTPESVELPVESGEPGQSEVNSFWVRSVDGRLIPCVTVRGGEVGPQHPNWGGISCDWQVPPALIPPSEQN
jgi:hypothetical protein